MHPPPSRPFWIHRATRTSLDKMHSKDERKMTEPSHKERNFLADLDLSPLPVRSRWASSATLSNGADCAPVPKSQSRIWKETK